MRRTGEDALSLLLLDSGSQLKNVCMESGSFMQTVSPCGYIWSKVLPVKSRCGISEVDPGVVFEALFSDLVPTDTRKLMQLHANKCII